MIKQVLKSATIILGLLLGIGASPAWAQIDGLKAAATRSGIWVGAAMDTGMPLDQQADLKTHFTALTSENAFKWGSMEATQGQNDFSATDQMVQFANTNHLRIRAHTLFWHRMQNPGWLRDQIDSAADQKTRLYQIMDERISQVAGRYKGRIDVWDVVNEPLQINGKGWDTKDDNGGPANFFYLAAGEKYIDHAFQTAHQVDPHAKLFLNEYLSRPAAGDLKSEALLSLVKRLKSRHVPIDGVGLQMHGLGSVRSPFFSNSSKELAQYMKSFTDLGLHVEITELDISLPAVVNDFGVPGMNDQQHLELQAKLYGNIARTCAAVSGCSGITVWGLRDKDSWLNSFVPGGPHRPLLLDDNGTPKPSYQAVRTGILGAVRIAIPSYALNLGLILIILALLMPSPSARAASNLHSKILCCKSILPLGIGSEQQADIHSAGCNPSEGAIKATIKYLAQPTNHHL